MVVKNCHYCHYRLHFHFLVPSKATSTSNEYEMDGDEEKNNRNNIQFTQFFGFCLLWCNMRLIMPIDKWVFNFIFFIFSSVINKIGVYYSRVFIPFIRGSLCCGVRTAMVSGQYVFNITPRPKNCMSAIGYA